jgi:hypothetical protein
LRVRGRGRRGAACGSSYIWYQSEKIPEACGDGGEMPLKPTMVVAANSMRDGRRPREVKAAGGVMPLAAGRGVMPRGGDSAMLSRSGAGGVIPLGADGDGERPYKETAVRYR